MVRERIRELDGVRGLAILMVLLWHYVAVGMGPHRGGTFLYYADRLMSYCWSGVDLFFVLSGFLIGGILLDYSGRTGFLKTFWVRRACRILPVLCVLVGSAFGLAAILPDDFSPWLFEGLMPWWSYLTFTQNIFMGIESTMGGHFLAVTWSLAIEEQFYLFAPLCFAFVGGRRLVPWLAVLCLVSFMLRGLVPASFANVNTLFRLDGLCLGILLAAAYRDERVWAVILQVREGLLKALVAMVVVTLGGAVWGVGLTSTVAHLWFAVIYSLLIVYALAFASTRWTAWLRWSWLCYLGLISYGVYLYHEAINGLVHAGWRAGTSPSFDSWSAIGLTGLALAGTLGFASLSFFAMERPIQRWGRRSRYPDAERGGSVTEESAGPAVGGAPGVRA
ncbi:MAG: acyltransferase [Planctomycetota bacterium]